LNAFHADNATAAFRGGLGVVEAIWKAWGMSGIAMETEEEDEMSDDDDDIDDEDWEGNDLDDDMDSVTD
jgi:hypothetical protein